MKKDKYDIILNAAKNVFAEGGYHGSSISKIAKEAGLGDGTIYLYFKNKEDILLHLFDKSIFHALIPQTEEAIKYSDDPRVMLYELIRSYFTFFGSDYELSRVIQIEFRQPNANTRNITKKGVKRYIEFIAMIVEKGQKQGIFRNDVKASSIHKMIFGTLDEFVTAWVLAENKYELISKVEDAYKLIIQSIYNLKNYEKDIWLGM